MHNYISSLQNKNVKTYIKLQEKSRDRRKSGRFVIEGRREIRLAIESGYRLDAIYVCPDLIRDFNKEILFEQAGQVIEVSLDVYRKMAYRESTEGILAIAQNKSHDVANIALPENPLVLVAEAPEKPGNIGALLRTADAADVDAVFIANPRTDLYNPNIIRSSVGGIFTRQIAMGSSSEIIAYLNAQKIKIYCAALQASTAYTAADYCAPTAIVVGTEADGLSKEWLQQSAQNIIIPMQGEIDSMNVSVSAGILIFEAKRQRKESASPPLQKP